MKFIASIADENPHAVVETRHQLRVIDEHLSVPCKRRANWAFVLPNQLTGVAYL